MKFKVLIKYLDIDKKGNRVYSKKPKSKFSTKVIVLKGGPWLDKLILKFGNGEVMAFKYNEKTLSFLKKVTSEYFAVTKVYKSPFYSYYLVSRYSKEKVSNLTDLLKQCHNMGLITAVEYWDNLIPIELWRC